MHTFIRNAAWLAAGAWAGLVVARGQFWDARSDRLANAPSNGDAPDIHVVVPARNEGDVIGRTVESVLAQRYPGRVALTVVDDRSEDDTARNVALAAKRARATDRVSVYRAEPRPEGWSGKVWAMAQGVDAARAGGATPAYWWFTDADVEHARRYVGALGGDRAQPASRSRFADGGTALHGAVGAVAGFRRSCSSSACCIRSRG